MDNKTEQIKLIFAEAYKKKTADEQTDYLERKCGTDTGLRAEVESLLEAYDDAEGFLEAPILNTDVTLDDSPISEGPGTIIGRYKLLEKIGEGGMAVVYMAEQEKPIRRKVALKIIKLGMDTKSVIARFEAERQALAMMDHPNIAKVLDAGATETGRPYFVMELVTGLSITEYCDKNNLRTKQRLALFIQVCNAVQHAHHKGIIHRDIKPSNVMITQHEGIPVPKVIDFGIAKATKHRLTEKTLFTRYAHIIGTPAYMSPEQADMSDLDVDTRSDIYSLGVLLYELLTGATPFSEEELRKAGYIEMQRVICEEEPPKPSTKLSTLGETLTAVAKYRCSTPDLLRKLIRGDLDWIVMKSLDKDRVRRYKTASEFTADIERHLNSEPVLARPPSKLYQMKKFVQRHRASATLVAAIMAGFVVSTAMFFRAEQARQAEAAAHAEAQTVVDFLTGDLLASVYPEKVGSQGVTVRYILDAASENLSNKLRNSPLSEAAIRDTLGLTYQKMGDYRAAEPHMRRALQIRREQLGDDDPTTLASLDGLGWLHWYQGRLEEAETLLIEAYETRQQILGSEHRDTLESMTHLAWMGSRNLGEMSLEQTAYQTGLRVLGEDHPITLSAVTCLAMKHVGNLRHVEAAAIAPRAYEISQRVLGEEHETTLVLMNVLAWLYERQKRYNEGVELSKRAFETGQRVFGETHMVTIYSMGTLGSLYAHQGRYEEAAPLLTGSVELARQHVGEARALTICLSLKLTTLYGRLGKYDEYDALVIELLETSRRKFGEKSVLTRYSIYRLRSRIKKLTELAKEQNASGDSEGAAATLTRLGELRHALEGDSEKSMERHEEQ